MRFCAPNDALAFLNLEHLLRLRMIPFEAGMLQSIVRKSVCGFARRTMLLLF
jgi:hypothetical protein